jgi:PAS domain S-box-containing protein
MLLLRRVPPNAIVNRPEMLDYLLHKETKHNNVMTTTRSVFHSAQNAIVCCSRTGIIDSINLQVTHILGFIPEQLLGQSTEVIFNAESGKEVQNRMEMMKRFECTKTYEGIVVCETDEGKTVSCNLTMKGMTSGEKSGDVSSFVFILKDVTRLLEQQQEAEEAKAKSEHLLYQILPRGIVNKLNQGEKDISFVVDSATLLFIDIQKFSEYAANLTPQEIMGNLSLIFCGFDDLLPKYPLITKIKLIGDVYMCGAGLFSPNVDPKVHAEQMVRFALDALQVIEETNLKLDSNLSVRIGINTGGPIIAGVLGTDKPVFDIIGDPINIAARLQSTCIPNKVQISEGTYELVKDMDFLIEARGEVWLKGKGKRPAFLVIPSGNYAFGLSNPCSARLAI